MNRTINLELAVYDLGNLWADFRFSLVVNKEVNYFVWSFTMYVNFGSDLGWGVMLAFCTLSLVFYAEYPVHFLRCYC